MTLPWTRARLTAQAALADASYAAQKANDAFECAERTLKLCNRVLLLDMLACLVAILFIYALTRSKNA